MSEPLRNYTQAAEWLGVPEKWLQDRVQKGLAPHTRLGKHVRFTQGHLDEIVRAGEKRPPTPVAVAPAQVELRPSTRRRRRAPA